MKKYVRTRDTIYEIVEDRHDNMWLVVKEHKPKDYNIKVSLLRAIKQANTIEELCDEFVYKYINPYHSKDKPSYELVNMTLKNMKLTMEMTSGATFYGAIWTDKGLIYVAKMNEKGCLELI